MRVHAIAEVNGIQMPYCRFGEGKRTLVILPGVSVQNVSGSVDVIAESFQIFCEQFTVYLFDRKSGLEDGATIESMAADTAEVMRGLGIECADLYGASQGGMIAMMMALNAPELVHSVSVCSTAARSTDQIESSIEGWITAAEQGERRTLAERFVNAVYSEETVRQFGSGIIESSIGYSEEDGIRFIRQCRALKNFDILNRLSEIRCPMLVMGSRGDRVLGYEASEEIAEKTGAVLHLYEDSFGHAVYDEAPDLKERILRFLTDNEENTHE